jgi:Peptidase family M23
MFGKRALFVLVTQALCAGFSSAVEIQSVLAHPIFEQVYTCTEHWQGNLKGFGDELGTDCLIERLVEVNGRTWLRPHAGKGAKNEDWFGWNQNVLSPCTCEVVKLTENSVVNVPGILGNPPASFVVLQRTDGVSFLLAHVASVRVKVGEHVAAGQVIAAVGNNGYARHPHIHVGAWRDGEPLQIRFDQAAMGRLLQR